MLRHAESICVLRQAGLTVRHKELAYQKPGALAELQKSGVSCKQRFLGLRQFPDNMMPLLCGHGRDRQPVTPSQNHHIGQLRLRSQLRQANESDFFERAHIDQQPARIIGTRFGVMIRTLAIELRRVGIAGAGYFRNAGDAGFGATGVIEQDAIADLHLIAHEVTRLIVAHTRPRHSLILGRQRIIDAGFIGFGFHQPITHIIFMTVIEFCETSPLSIERVSEASIKKAAACNATARNKVPPVPLRRHPEPNRFKVATVVQYWDRRTSDAHAY